MRCAAYGARSPNVLAVVLWVVAMALPGVSPAKAAESLANRRLKAVPVAEQPAIDGDLTDPVWQKAARLELFSDSFTSSTEIDQTDGWICYDAEGINVAFHCHDAQPAEIVGREIRRDASFDGEDTVTFILDPYRSRRGDDSNYFITNCLGTPSSYLAGGRASKAEWKGDWLCAARRVDDGWTAEMRIPWKILNYPAADRPTTMGINFYRRQQRTRILSYWSNLGPQSQQQNAGDWEEVKLPRTAFKRQVSLLPYSTTGFNLKGGRPFGFGLGRSRTENAGLDVRTALTPDLTAVGSLNPDFSTVESAVAGIDFTRGERFVADNRPFFLEGGNFFELNNHSGRGWGNAFFSGRVPAFDAGAKVYGRYGRRDGLGFLGTWSRDRDRADVVGRWVHDVGPGSYVGGYFVEHSDPSDQNTVIGVNQSIRKRDWIVRSDFAGTFGTRAGGKAANAGVRWQGARLRAQLSYNYVEPRFRPANGFVQFDNYRGPDATLRYTAEWRKGPVRLLDLFASGQQHQRLDGAFFRRSLNLSAYLETRSDWQARAAWEGGRFEQGHDSEFTLAFTRNVSNRFRRAGLSLSAGERDSRPITYLAPMISHRLFRKWDLSLSSSLLRHKESSALHALSFSREFDRFRAFGGRAILRDGHLRYYISYRISGGKGMETYFLLGDPDAQANTSRTFFITKLVFPVGL